jgi:ParB-like chromosome segregation protein Spo0J
MLNKAGGHDLYFGIVSHQRPDKVKEMMELVAPLRPTWHVPGDQIETYMKKGVMCAIGSSHSRGSAANTVIRAAGRTPLVLILDDDLRKVEQASIGEDASKEEITFEAAITIMVERLLMYPEFRLAGAAPVANAYFARRHISTSLYCRAGVNIIRKPAPMYDERIMLKEDYDYCCHHLSVFGGLVRCDDLLFHFSQRTKKGGCADLRADPAINQADVVALLERWPQYLSPHPTREGELKLKVKGTQLTDLLGPQVPDEAPESTTSQGEDAERPSATPDSVTSNGSDDPAPPPPADDDLFTSPEGEAEDPAGYVPEAPPEGHQIDPELLPLKHPIDDFQPHPDNYNVGDVKAIMYSLSFYNQVRAILVQKSTGYIVAGNHTWKAAKALAWEYVAANVVDMTDAQARKYLVADNAIARKGKWSETKISELVQLSLADGASVQELGYNTMDELEDQLELLTPTAAGEETPAEYASNAEQEARAERRKTEPLKEVVLMLPASAAQEFGVQVQALQSEYDTKGVTETVREAVRRAHAALTEEVTA